MHQDGEGSAHLPAPVPAGRRGFLRRWASPTRLTLSTAAAITLVSVSLFFVRRHMLGAEINGPRGASTWRITEEVSGELPDGSAAVITLPPLDFRFQHIFDEILACDQLTYRVRQAKASGRREITWQRRTTNGPQLFYLYYTFTCSLGQWPPTPGMERMTEVLDAPPAVTASPKHAPFGKATFLRPGFRIESEYRAIQRTALELAQQDMPATDKARALFNFVHRLETVEAPETQSALECLQQRGGGSAGKARLLVALCRNRAVPARVVSGLVLTSDREQGLHFWAEAWLNNYWLPMDPSRGYYGARSFPPNYLVFQIGDEDLARARDTNLTPHFNVTLLAEASPQQGPGPLNGRSTFWRKLSLYRLRPAEQQLVRFLLLLPLAALIVSLFRTIIGTPTFGTFAPALMGLAFLDPKILPWGMIIYFVIVLFGWVTRRMLDRYHLLMVPRVSVMLTLIIVLIVSGIAVGAHFGIPATSYLSLVPIVILTHLVERFWTVETEDGTVASFKALLGTFLVSVVISLSLSPEPVGTWMFRYPETTGVVLACQLVLGRYTGYRLTELYRFQDLIHEDHPPSATHAELDQKMAESAGPGRAGDEPAQRPVHPGSEPAAPVPGGGRQTADAGPVPADRRPDA
jgi:transglutaminase-like putative cysteine protease